MKTDSLRIGNYVLHAGKVIAVTSVFPKGINAHTDRSTDKVSYIPADRIKPSPPPVRRHAPAARPESLFVNFPPANHVEYFGIYYGLRIPFLTIIFPNGYYLVSAVFVFPSG